MKLRKISIMVLCIAVLSILACLAGLLSKGGNGQYEFKSITNETVTIYGTGLYKNDSVSTTAQGKASDFVTLLMGVPLLLISLYYTVRGSFKGKITLTGTLGYFLYTYMSYTFLWTYNPFFIVYVALMSLSLFAFIMLFSSFDVNNITQHFTNKLPIKFLGGFQLFIAFALAIMWLGKIAPSITQGAVPAGLEHYTTLVIQGMDLGIVAPTALISGIMLFKRKPFGYLLTSVIIMKAITMLTNITAMIINQALAGVNMNIAEVVVFLTFTLFTVICLVILLKNIIEKPTAEEGIV